MFTYRGQTRVSTRTGQDSYRIGRGCQWDFDVPDRLLSLAAEIPGERIFVPVQQTGTLAGMQTLWGALPQLFSYTRDNGIGMVELWPVPSGSVSLVLDFEIDCNKKPPFENLRHIPLRRLTNPEFLAEVRLILQSKS